MIIVFHSSFDKDYKKLSSKIKLQFKIRRNLFLEDQFHPLLNNHTLQGKYFGCRSINITGDYRVIYYASNGLAVFIHIGTHTQLYGK